MTLTWVVCGAGRHVGKTRLAQRLCQVLPDAVYAKQGHGTRKPDKPANLFHTDADLADFLGACRGRHAHVVVESNELARSGEGDIVIFLEGVPGRTDYRADADLLRSRADLCVGADASLNDWETALRGRVESPELRAAVCAALAEQQHSTPRPAAAVQRVEPLRVMTDGGPAVRDPGHVVVEELLTIMIDGVGSFALLCTPVDVEALAVGFAFSEGLIESCDDVVDLNYRPTEHTIGLRLDVPRGDIASRNLIVTSSCGLCGSRNIDRLLSGQVVSGDSLRVSATLVRCVAEDMRARQALFAQTGGAHAAAIFAADAAISAFAEDIGRHNALDKAIGCCLLNRRPLRGCGVMLSGRVSLELVAKAARAGLQLIAAVSAPSSLALQAAERCNITLCGFVRDDRATVYTHPHRITGVRL